MLHDPEKNPPKEVVSQILFVTLPCLSLDFLFLFATRRYVEFFDMARPWAAFVAQDIKSIIKTIVLRNIITKMNMRTFTFKGLFLTVLFVLLGSLAIQAADDGLITKQITLKLDEAGTLPNRIAVSKKNLITNLKIVGEVNGTDLKFIREMAGCDFNGEKTDGKLSILDLSEAKIVEGGDAYVRNIDNQYTSNDKLGESAFLGCSGLTSLTIPSSVTSIGDRAFGYCSGLTSLTLPSGVTSIGWYAFYGCCGLTSLTLPSSVTSIGWYAFYGCSGLTSLTIPSGVTEIGEGVFHGCSGLTSLTIPSGVTLIRDKAFYGCSGLTSLTIPSGVTSIRDYAFAGCCGLTSLTIPSGVTSIGKSAFEGCSGLTSIYAYLEKIPKLGSNVFTGCDAKNCILYVPTGTIDDYWLSEFGYFEKIVEFDATGIDKVTTSTNAKEVSRYSANGQRLSAPAKGLNIVKYSDGSVKKVVVQ